MREHNAATIARHLDKLVFHDGADDDWVADEHHADDLGRLTVDALECGHAFCLEDSDAVTGLADGNLKEP